ncbi:Asp23/Gls24 family envelope stress response protein [Plantactinospora sp. KBS50]|uniref:Asp23/Gls24 family envelope stress response protein n=1 Tax=Plantactinospora sp. KBS50 TaxID=2024580 RepID=UPI00269733D2
MSEAVNHDQTLELAPVDDPAMGRVEPLRPVIDEADPARGATRISGEVVEKIAAAAAKEVPGVVELGGDVARFVNSVLDRVGLTELGDARRGVSATVNGGDAAVDIVIVIDGGHVVHEVTEAVRARVADAIRRFGLRVTAVNVEVDDVALDGVPGNPSAQGGQA